MTTNNEQLSEQIRASIETFRNRTRYTELDAAVLAQIADDKLEQAILDFIDCREQGSGQPTR